MTDRYQIGALEVVQTPDRIEVFDAEERLFRLDGSVSVETVKAAIGVYYRGHSDGSASGAAKLQAELRQLLGITS